MLYIFFKRVQLFTTIVMIVCSDVMKRRFVRRLDRDGNGANAEIFPLAAFAILFGFESRFDQFSLLFLPRFGGRHQRAVRVLVERDFLDSGADVWHPGRIDHRQRFHTDPGRWQGELDGVWWHFE
jgi:hypothetical protein